LLLVKKILSAFFYFLFFLLFISQILLELNPEILVPAKQKVVIMLLLAGLSVSAALFRSGSQKEDEKKYQSSRTCVFLLFLVYLFNLVILLFFDPGFRLSGYQQTPDYSLYLSLNTNFVPFSTIMRYYAAWRRHSIPMYYVVVNLLGNFLAFAPFGFFLPVLRERFFALSRFLPAAAAMIVFAEAAQFVFRVGSCDVDDFILNFSGTVLVFLIVRTKSSRTFLAKHHIVRSDL